MHHAVYLTQRASPSARARASSATRQKTRLHPYAQSSCLSPPHSAFLITPASSVSSSPATLYSLERPRILPSTSAISQSTPHRDVHKSRYVTGLVDQAVKSLCEIWPPSHIPEVFWTSSRVILTPSKDPSSLRHEFQRFHCRNTQLPSPVSSQSSPTSPPHSRPNPPTDAVTKEILDQESNLVPLKGFVHEVLRRSRTSGNVLQTALCYLEAIRSKVPDLVRTEEAGEAVHGEMESVGRIIKAEDLSDAEAEAMGMSVPLDSIINTDNCASTKQLDNAVPTVLCTDDDVMDIATSFSDPLPPPTHDDELNVSDLLAKKHNKGRLAPLPPLPPLPSPLLCPRRAFLAALILASKFTQDRCYSNKAWAKLSGLPPREIGRCERALGDALDWRLWVGKTPTASPTPDQIRIGRAVVRSRSEGDLFPKAKAAGSSKKTMKALRKKDVELFGYPRDWNFRSSDGASAVNRAGPMMSPTNPRPLATLRRNATLPPDAFSTVNKEDSSMSIPEPPEMPVLETHLVCESTTSESSSISPSTPPLSYSPASTESNSDGDRTIQMSSFIDISTPPPAKGYPPVGDQKGLVLPSFVHSYGCGYSPADPASGTYPRQLSYCGLPSYQDSVDINNHLYT